MQKAHHNQQARPLPGFLQAEPVCKNQKDREESPETANCHQMEKMTPVKDYEGNIPVVVGTGLTQSTSGTYIRGPSKTNVLALTRVAFAGNRL